MTGLEHRYDVVKRSTGEAVTDCFVLVPGKDVAAKVALRAYAEHSATPPELREDLHAWLDECKPPLDKLR